MQAETLLADKAYDAEARVLEPPAAACKTAVIPPKGNRTWVRDHGRNFLGAIHLAACVIWLN